MAIHYRCVCGERLRFEDAQAGKSAKCPNCGVYLRIPVADKRPTPEPQETKHTPRAEAGEPLRCDLTGPKGENVLATAIGQRRLLWMILIKILVYPVAWLAAYVGDRLLGLFVMLMVDVMVLIFIVNLLGAMKESVLGIVLYCVFIIVPCIGILMLLFINGRATKLLRNVGLRVGLMGVSMSQLSQLQIRSVQEGDYDSEERHA